MTSSSKKTYKISKEDCVVCCESCNVKYFVKCPFCPFKCCRECTERFLLDTNSDIPYCMNPDCKKQWTFEFITDNFDKSFHNKRYREYTNNNLEKTGNLFGNVYPNITEDWDFYSNSKRA